MTIDRTPKPCLHPGTEHQHGDRLAYQRDGCRCLPCCFANSSYESLRRRQQAYGRTPAGWVDAAPVRAHVKKLQAAGLGWKPIARLADVPTSTMTRLLFGKGGYAPSRRINPASAARLLALPMPTVTDLCGGAVIDGTVTRRRLQALVAAGWTQAALAARLGMSTGNFASLIHGHHRKTGDGRVVAATHRAVVALYAELSDVPGPPTYGRSRALQAATAHGWVPPEAWDDDSIDDPHATPYLGEDDEDDDVDEFVIDLVLDGQPMTLTGRDIEVAVLRLAEAGHDYAAIAARCRSDETTVRRILNTARRRSARAAAKEHVA